MGPSNLTKRGVLGSLRLTLIIFKDFNQGSISSLQREGEREREVFRIQYSKTGYCLMNLIAML